MGCSVTTKIRESYDFLRIYPQIFVHSLKMGGKETDPQLVEGVEIHSQHPGLKSRGGRNICAQKESFFDVGGEVSVIITV